MTIYIDNEYKCLVADSGNMLAHETEFFNGKCRAYIEGFRCVPDGYEYDGKVAVGDMYFPWADVDNLMAAQQGYEEALAEANAAYEEGVNSIYE